MGCFKWGFTFEGPRLKQPILKRGLYILFIDVDAQNIFSDSDFRFQRSDLRGRIRDQNQKSVIRSQLSVYIFFTGERNILRRHFITQNYATFLQRTKVRGGIPDFVKEEFESYLKCGILAHGFLRIPFIKI